jgi:hypothetical protein
MQVCGVAWLALTLAIQPVAAPQAGAATGHMVVNGKTFALTHAYAVALPGRRDKTKVEIRVVLSDVAIADADLDAPAKVEALATSGRLHAMVLLLGDDPMGHPGKAPVYIDIYDAAFNGAQQPMRLQGQQEFETRVDERTTIAGRHFMPSSFTFSDIGNNVTFQDDVTFSATIGRSPTAMR